MKSLRFFLSTAILLISFVGFSQKIKLKDNTVLVDEVAWLKYQDCGAFDKTCSLLSMNNEELIFFKFVNLEGVEPKSASNPKGTLGYVEVKFLGFNKLFEIQKMQKGIIQLLFNSKVVNEKGELDEEKAATLVEKYGTEFSDRLNRSTNSSQTIIIKEEPRKSGVNINIGR
jgi:hypothetical protein